MVAGAEQELSADVNRAVLLGAYVDRRVPVVPQFSFAVLGQRLDAAQLVRLAIDAADLAPLRLGVKIIRVRWVSEHPKAIAAVHILPMLIRDPTRILRVADPGAVVLKTAINVIGRVHVDGDVIKLRDR